MTTVLLAAVVAMLIAIVGTRLFIGFLARKGYGQPIRDEGPTTHNAKRGTPTMGGVVIVIAVTIAYLGAHLVAGTAPSASGLLVLGVFIATAILGFIDDWTKISRQRSLGLTPLQKIIGQVCIGCVFGYLALQFPDERGITPASDYISFTRDIPFLHIGLVLAVIWMTLLITSVSNALNLTDGLDGLATGSSVMVFVAYALINIWQRNQWCALASTTGPLCYDVRNPYDLAVLSIALGAACFGFLWWNAKPAKIFLGDTGSLGLGAAMGGLAIMTRTELLLIFLGALFVMETLSVMLQVSYFKYTHGKRLFKMTPLHHHFELLGWDEVTVVIRFWIICGIAVAVGCGIFYGEWVLAL